MPKDPNNEEYYWIYYYDFRAGLLGPTTRQGAIEVSRNLQEEADRHNQRLVIRIICGSDVTMNLVKEW